VRQLMSSVVLCLMLISGFGLSGCEEDNSEKFGSSADGITYTADEIFWLRTGLVSQSRFRIEAFSGSIAIAGMAGTDSVIIMGEKRVESASLEDAQDQLELFEVIMEEGDNEILVRTNQPEEAGDRTFTVDYFITIPEFLSVDCNQIVGDVAIYGMEGVVSIDNGSGQIALGQTQGNTYVDLTSGNIEGVVIVPDTGTINMRLSAGTIDLAIPQTTSARIYATVTSGSIVDSALELNEIIRLPNLLYATVGTAKGTIILKVTSGSIVITGFEG
jgi:DUF4097 and DUF4098 domain-containing protein YvlB